MQTGGESSSTPRRRIAVSMCSRLSLECEEPPFISTLDWAPNAHSAHEPRPTSAEHNRRVSYVLRNQRPESPGDAAP